jgi:ubiquinone/menaquinone biosynthesis C-methylase UbiE
MISKTTMEFLNILRCPITSNELSLIESNHFKDYNLPEEFDKFGKLTHGLIEKSKHFFYPVFDGILILHQQYAICIGNETDSPKDMPFNKKRVFDYYNEVNYKIRDSLDTYEDSKKWVDYRSVSLEYLKNSFNNASRFYPPSGKFILDIASGPIGTKEYMALSNGYEYRICIDISINALVRAKINMEKANKKGIFICGDITKIPLQNNTCDTVLCQHTLYHVPKSEQFDAVNEMYRVAKDDSKIVIIYSWFYHSWLMNITLNIIQLYRIIRHFLGKLYVKIFRSKPRLYFYSHSLKWFKKSFPFSGDLEIFCWRSTNKYFLKIFIHKWLFGRLILNKLIKIENKYSKLMGIYGEYPALVITKNKTGA